MIYEIVWDTDGVNPGDYDLPKYVVVNNTYMTNPLTGEDYPDPPVFHIIPKDYPEVNVEEELGDIMSDIFDWAVSSFYMVSNDTFADDMTFYSQNNYVTYEFI